MDERERLEDAERFVRRAVSHFTVVPSEEKIKSAARKVLKSLPPFKRRRK